ncbi:MAG: polysaccharide biosynthesis tyrosine autokinase [Oceanicaulis sp.]
MSAYDAEAPGRGEFRDDEAFDLRSLFNVFRRRFWIMAFTAALTLAFVVVVTFQTTPLYTSTASVLLETRERQVVDFESVISGLPPDSAIVDTEVQVIASRSLAEKVVARLNLQDVPEFNPALRDPPLRVQIMETVRGVFGAARPAPAGDAADASELAAERVVDAVMNSLEARRVGTTYLIEISATSRSPRLAQQIANAYADEYLLSQLEAKFEATERANDWLNTRVADLRDEVRTAEQAVARFRAQEDLLNAEGATLTEQQISDINAQLASQRAELSEAQARLRGVRSRLAQGVSPESIGEVLRSDVVRELRAQQAQVTRRQGELATRYGPRHPEILSVERELADIQEQINQEVQRIVSSLESEVEVARERVLSLETSLADLRADLAAEDASLVRLRELEREAEASRALFESFLNRFRQTDASEQLTDADAQIVARAAVPTQASSPNFLLNLALGVVLAGIAAAGVAAALELLDSGLRTEPDVEAKLGLPHVASVPKLKSSLLSRVSGGRTPPERYVMDKPLSSFAESFRTLRSAISLSSLDSQARTIAITSALPGEGKTTITVCFGRIAASAADRVVVVDCDLRRRQLSKQLAPKAKVGLLEVLARKVALQDAIVQDAASKMDVLPTAGGDFTPQDVFRSESFSTLLKTLAEHYDLVVIDTAPVLAVADTRTIASLTDRVVFVAEWGRSSVGSVKLALSALRASKARMAGVVLNSVDVERQGRYGYGAYYGYYRSYRKYYTD